MTQPAPSVPPELRSLLRRLRLGQVLDTLPERAALAALESWGLVDAFRQRYPDDRLFSWWDYRGGSFHRHRGMRIDLVLVTEVLARNTTFALIDRQARKGEKPSDHTPVFIDTSVD